MRNSIKLLRITLLMCTLMFTTGCIHYYPEMIDGEDGRDPTKVSVAIQLEFNPTISFSKLLSRQQVDEPIYQRFVIEVSKSGSVVAHKEAYFPADEMQENTEITLPFEIPLHAVEYDVSVWSDYCVTPAAGGALYDASSLVPVVCASSYQACSELKVCYYANTSIDLRPYRDSWDYHHKLNLVLDKPVGKYQIMTTDIKAFLRNNDSDSLHVRVEYNDYHPFGFNVPAENTEMYNDGVMFNNAVSTHAVDENGELCLAYDYIFVPPNVDRTTRITLTISDDKGELIVKYNNIEISYRAGKVTTLYGKFLTQTSSGGIGIDPNWEDEIIIEI